MRNTIGMFESAIAITVISVLATVASVANQLVLARLFGAGELMDTYLIAASLPGLVAGIAGGAVSYAAVPALVVSRTQGEEPLSKLVTGLLVSITIVGLLIATTGAIFARPILATVSSTFTDARLQLAVDVARMSWISTAAALLASYFSAINNATRRFIWPVVASILPYIGMTTFSILASEPGIPSIALGMLVGTLASIMVVLLPARHHIAWGGASDWTAARQVMFAMPAVALSLACTQVFGTVDAFWGSTLPIGSVSYLAYGQRIVIGIGSLLVLGPSVVLVPYLSQAAAAHQTDDFRRVGVGMIRAVLTLSAPIVLWLIVTRVSLIELLFQRGAFDQQATAGVARILPGLLVGMLGMTCFVLALRALHSKQDTPGAAAIGGIGAAGYFVLAGIGSRLFGLEGIAIAYSITWWVLLAVAARRAWFEEEVSMTTENREFLGALCSCLIATAVVLIPLWSYLQRPMSDVGHTDLAVRLSISAAIASTLFVGIALKVFRLKELSSMIDRIAIMVRARSHA